jgi:ATP synthase protein I
LKRSAAQLAQLKKPKLMVIFAIQIFILLVILASAWLLSASHLTLISITIGAAIFITPNAYFSYYAFRYAGARAAQQVAQSFYRGEAGKFMLTAIMFAVSFAVVRPINAVAVFAVYIFFMALTWMLAWQMTK